MARQSSAFDILPSPWIDQISALSRHADKQAKLSNLNTRHRAQLEQAELCRENIIGSLSDVESATANQVSEAMGINKNTARERLVKMTADGVLSFTSTHPRQWKIAK